MPYEKAYVEEEKQERARQRAKGNACPMCLEASLTPFGGRPTCWWECTCGAYSPMKKTWEEAYEDAGGWQDVDPELNARMSPPIGG